VLQTRERDVTTVTLYAGHFEDTFVKRALEEFKKLEGAVTSPLWGGAPAPHNSMMVISSYGIFPSRFGRIFREGDASRQIVLPHTACYAKKVLVLNKNAEDYAIAQPEHFREAIRNFHFELSGLPRPANSRKRNAIWRSNHQARRARELAGDDRSGYAL
jgi:hypothetical protein